MAPVLAVLARSGKPLLVHLPFPGETDPRRNSNTFGRQVAGVAAEFVSGKMTPRQMVKWRRQVDELHRQVRGWTGNPLQVLEMSSLEWADHRRRHSTLFKEITRDAIKVAEPPSPLIVTQPTAAG